MKEIEDSEGSNRKFLKYLPSLVIALAAALNWLAVLTGYSAFAGPNAALYFYSVFGVLFSALLLLALVRPINQLNLILLILLILSEWLSHAALQAAKF